MLTIRSTKWVLGTENHSSPALLKLETKSERAPLGMGQGQATDAAQLKWGPKHGSPSSSSQDSHKTKPYTFTEKETSKAQ